MKEVRKYQTVEGREPFNDWFERLDWRVQALIDSFIFRMACGGAKKNIKPVGEGVFEIKIDHGPGYRIYFGDVGRYFVLLLFGGDKGSQTKDIRRAKLYWKHYLSSQSTP